VRPFQKWLLWMSSLAAGTTGVVFWWMDSMMEPLGEWAVINHPLQPWVLKAHILSTPVLVFAVGLIATDHIWRHFRNAVRPGRRSGVSTMWVVAPMVLTGYLIQAVTHQGWLVFLAWLHLAAGVFYVLALLLHQVAVRRWRGSENTPPAQGMRPYRKEKPVAQARTHG
jgi:uncharacterized membrane protein